MHRQLAQHLRSLQPKGDPPILPGEHGEIMERLEVGQGKMAFWGTIAAISLKLVKIEENLLCGAYRNSPMLFRTVPSPTPYGLPFIEIEVCNLATPSYLGGYIYRANRNKSPLKILEKRERGRIQGLPEYFGYPLLSQERVQLRTSNFVATFTGSIRTKAHEKCCEQQPWAQTGSPENFKGTHVYGTLCGHLCDSTAFLEVLEQ